MTHHHPVITAALLVAIGLLLIPIPGCTPETGRQAAAIDVRACGAVGDGTTLDTRAIQQAIDDCHGAGGGTVRVPAGSYRVGTLRMRSHVRLELATGAKLLGSQRLEDYDTAGIRGAVEAPAFNRCLIYAEDATDLSFTGAGIIDGCGSHRVFPCQVGGQLGERPMLMRLEHCTRVRISGLTLLNPAAWTIHLVGCIDVGLEGVTIRSKGNNANNDGIDMDGCADVRIRGCDFSTGDDAVCLKSTLAIPCRNIDVSACRLSSDTAAFKLGTSSRAGFIGIRLSDSHLYDCPMGTVKLQIVDGGILEDVVLSDLTMTNVRGPIFLRLGNRGRLYDHPTEQVYGGDVSPEGAHVGTLRRVVIRNVTAEVAGGDLARNGIMIAGIPGHRIQDVLLENVRIRLPGGGDATAATRRVPEDVARYPEQFFFGVLPAWGLFLRHAERITLQNVRIDSAAPDGRPAFHLEDAGTIVCDRLSVDGTAVTLPATAP